MATTNLRWLLAAALTATLAITTAAQSSSGGGVPSCATKLTGCAEYLNATKTPPKSCCDPLNEALTKEKDCLCGLYKNPDLLKTFGVNITQAMNLPKLCKLTTGQSSNFCQGSASPPTSGSGSPGGGSGSSSGSKSAAAKITGTGLVSSILLIVGACLFFY